MTSGWENGWSTRLKTQEWAEDEAKSIANFFASCGIRTLGALRIFGQTELDAAVGLYINDATPLGALKRKGICATLRVSRALHSTAGRCYTRPQLHISLHERFRL